MIDYVVEIAPPAEREITEAIQWYATKSLPAANTFRNLIFDSIALIANSPLSWAKVSERGIRRFVLPRYPYTLFFHVAGSTVTIVAVTHHHRAPTDWS